MGTVLLLALACSSSGDSTDAGPDVTPADVAEPSDQVAPPDVADVPDVPEAADTEAEVTNPDLLPELTTPVALRMGAAMRDMPRPIGIPISGFGPSKECGKGPYAENYPANDRMYTQHQWKAVVVEGGTGRMVFVRGDLVGIDAYTRQDVVLRLKARTGQDFSNTLIFGATHTHSGPARMSKNGMFQFVQDKFFPEHYERMITSIVDTIVDAFKDMEPVSMGFGVVDGTGLHNDRRCEDGQFDDPSMPVLRFKRLSDGSVKGVVGIFAIHGTVIGADNCMLSQDVMGGLERKIEEQFDTLVPVLFMNAWGGDMAPGDVPVDEAGSPVRHDYSRIEALGNEAAKRILDLFDGDQLAEQQGVVEIGGLTTWVPLGREALGYADDEFKYPNGGLYCGGTIEAPCWDDPGGQTPIATLDKACVPLPLSMAAPDRTLLTAAHIGDLYFVTFPGEPVTAIAQNIVAGIHATHPELKIVFIGYAQDYVGYSVPETTWWLGGYEPSGAMWGPKQGDYLTAKAIATMESFLNPGTPLSWTEPGPPTVTPSGAGVFVPTRSKVVGTWSKPPATTYGPKQMIEVTFEGGDNWYGMPRLELQKQVGDAFVTVLHKNKTPVATGSYEFDNEVILEPAFADVPAATLRTFHWTVRFATTRPAASTTEPLVGTFRFHVTGMARTADGEGPYQTDSTPFAITP